MAAPPSKKLKKRRGTPLLRLPPFILKQIFRYGGVVSSGNLTLSKALLPYTLHGLFLTVDVSRSRSLPRFAASLVRQPHLAKDVKLLHVDSACWPIPQNGVRCSHGQGLLTEWLRDSKATKDEPYEPHAFHCNIPVLQDVLASLPNLQHLVVVSEYLITSLLDRPFLERSHPLPIQQLSLFILPGEAYGEAASPAIYSNLALLPSLKSLCVASIRSEVPPLDALSLSPKSLAPRTLKLKMFSAMGNKFIGSESRILFQAFAPTLTHLHLETLFAHPSLLSDLALVPPTLTNLSFAVGAACPHYIADPHSPKLDNSLLPLYQPNLRHLHIFNGDVISPASLSVISSFPLLECLLLGPHANFDQSFLLDLVQRAQEGVLSHLRRISVGLCTCDRYREIWPGDLSRLRARHFVAVAERAGIEVKGSMMCTLHDGCEESYCIEWCDSMTGFGNWAMSFSAEVVYDER